VVDSLVLFLSFFKMNHKHLKIGLLNVVTGKKNTEMNY